MRKKDLEILLEQLKDIPEPSPILEQYPTPPPIAAEILHLAMMRGDIVGKRVLDLGCGSGTFTIGSVLLGSRVSLGVDVDEKAIHTSQINSRALGCVKNVHFVMGDVRRVSLPPFDTTIMNPPFGAQRRGADRPFLKKAAEVSRVVYTLTNGPSRNFTVSFMADEGFTIVGEKKYILPVKYRFRFHRRELAGVEAFLLIFERRDM